MSLPCKFLRYYLKDIVSIEGSSKGLLSARNRVRNALIFVAEDNELFPISVKELKLKKN